MKKFLLTFLLLLLASAAGHAATYAVRGQVTDSAGVAEPFATLRITAVPELPTSRPVLAVADAEGKFRVELPGVGRFLVTATAVGREPAKAEFRVDNKNPLADVGRLVMPMSNELGEVEVTAQRPLVSREIDRIGYDVSADPDAKTDMLTEILKKVPLVSVEPDGTVKVRGETSFQVYKNGRPNDTLNKNAKEIFKSIPASTIERIEVITDPGAREDAEGSGVILNIVTTRTVTFKGATGNVGLQMRSVNDMIPEPNVYLTTQIDKVTFSVTSSFSHSIRTANGPNHIWGDKTYDQTGNTEKFTQTNNNTSNVFYGGLELSWEPDTLNLFTFDMGSWNGAHRWWGTGTTRMVAPDGALLYGYTTDGRINPMHNNNVWGAVNYQHSTRLKGEAITLSYRVSHNHSKQVTLQDYIDAIEMPVPYDRTLQDTRNRFWEHTFQLDWRRPLSQSFNFDAGAKCIIRRQQNLSHLEYIPAWESNSDFNHDFDIAAVYGDLRFNRGRVGARTGVRYEYSHLNAKFRDGSNPDFGRSLNDIVPNAALQLNPTDNYSLRLGYSTSIQRPFITYLNPAVVESPTTVSYGNPHLKSMFYQNLSLTQSYFTTRLSLQLTVNYSWCNNSVTSVQWSQGDVAYSTYMGRGRTRSLYMGLWSQAQLGSKTSLNVNARLSRNERNQGPGELSFDCWSWAATLDLIQRLPWGLRLSAYAGVSSGYRDYYTKVSTKYDGTWINYSLSLQKSFLKDERLTVQASVGNPFKHDWVLHRITYLNSGYHGSGWQKDGFQNCFSLSLSYRFGSLQAQVKKTAGTIENNDIQK